MCSRSARARLLLQIIKYCLVCISYVHLPQLALAWVLAQGDHIIPIPGTKRRKYLLENAGAVEITLNDKDLAEIETLLALYPNTGARYNEGAYRLVDKN